jgi:hypothetical protein
MTRNVITVEFVIPTVLAIALGLALSIGAIYLINNYLSSIDQAEVRYLGGLVELG